MYKGAVPLSHLRCYVRDGAPCGAPSRFLFVTFLAGTDKKADRVGQTRWMRTAGERLPSMLDLRDICKRYVTQSFTQVALDSVSLSFRDNEFVAILGPSGSGKTTMLNVIGGLDHFDSGDLMASRPRTSATAIGTPIVTIASALCSRAITSFRIRPFWKTWSWRLRSRAWGVPSAASVRARRSRQLAWASTLTSARASFRAGRCSASPSPAP